MKKTVILGLAITIIACFATSCDVIPTDEYLTPVINGDDTTTTTTTRNILIEEFTGQRCQNCPKAHAEINKLQTLYGDKIIAIGIHAGFYAMPVAGYTADYRTVEGNAIHDYFGLTSYPKGVLNRTAYGSTFITDYTEWEEKVEDMIDDIATATITASKNFDTETQQLTVNIETNVKGTEAVTAGLCAFVVESGIVSPQANGEEIIEDYVHNHVLRSSFNGAWGERINGLGKDNKSYSMTWNNEWVYDNCNIVIYIYNITSKDILQVIEI
ncbi:MAG: Omp28 family outer membrane lipoprotein [Bacteroidales bacterium]|nr:Omp28 family outer membrane lipoprotein [Bacteroidales bacterium]